MKRSLLTQANFVPLPDAAFQGDIGAVRFLLETGANPEEQNEQGASALMLAVKSGHLEVAAILMNAGADPDRVDGTGKSPHDFATDGALEEFEALFTGLPVEALLTDDAPIQEPGDLPVKRRSRLRTVLTIVLYGIGIAIVIGAFTMKSYFKVSTQLTIVDAIVANNATLVGSMLTDGVNPNTRDTNGDSVTLFAANNGRADIVRLLLKNKADPNLGAPGGIAELKRAGMDHYGIVENLLDAGADPDRKDKNGNTLLGYACQDSRYANLISLLLKHSANPNVTGPNGPPLNTLIESTGNTVPDAVQELLAHGANPDSVDSAGTPAIVWAAEHGNPELIQALLKGGANLSKTDALHRTALHVACKQQRSGVVQTLLAAHANPNAQDLDGNTPAMYAVIGAANGAGGSGTDYRQLLQLLQQSGANLSKPNSAGQTPSSLAKENGLSGAP